MVLYVSGHRNQRAQRSRYHPWQLFRRLKVPNLPAAVSCLDYTKNLLWPINGHICPVNSSLLVVEEGGPFVIQSRTQSHGSIKYFQILVKKKSQLVDSVKNDLEQDDKNINASNSGDGIEEDSVYHDSDDSDDDDDDDEVSSINDFSLRQCKGLQSWFSYALYLSPKFSTCGNIYSAAINSGVDGLTLLGAKNLWENSFAECKILNKSLSGNLCGKVLACLESNNIFLVLINYKMRNNLADCSLLYFKLKDDMSLRFINSVTIKDLLKPYEPFLNHWEISPNLRNVLMILYDGSFFIIDLQSMKSSFYGNISTIFSGFSKERDYVNVIFHKNYKERCVIISHNNSVSSYDWKSKRDICLHKFEDQTENYIKNLSMAMNQALLAVSTYNGNVYTFDITTTDLKLLYILSFTPNLLPQKLLNRVINNSRNYVFSANFTISSEELIVCYYSRLVMIWQLPKRLCLKEICRLKVRTLWSKDVIEEFSNIPNVLKDYLLFKPMRD